MHDLRRVVGPDLERAVGERRRVREARRGRTDPRARGTGRASACDRGPPSVAGVPSATIDPAAITATRFARYWASSMKWVVRKIVFPIDGEVLHDLPRVASRVRIESGGRLVEEQELRVPGEGDGDIQTALLAAGELVHAGVPLLGEPDEVDHLVHVPGRGVEARVEGDRLADREVGVDARGLQDDADPLLEIGLGPRRVVAEDRDLAGRPVAVALQDLDRGRLPGAVRAEQGEDLAPVDVEVDAGRPPPRRRRTCGVPGRRSRAPSSDALLRRQSGFRPEKPERSDVEPSDRRPPPAASTGAPASRPGPRGSQRARCRHRAGGCLDPRATGAPA